MQQVARKAWTAMLALLLAFSAGVTWAAPVGAAYAATGDTAVLTVNKASGQSDDVSYNVYQLFEANVDDSGNATNVSWGSSEAKDTLLAFVKQETSETKANRSYDNWLQGKGFITEAEAKAETGGDKEAADAQRDKVQNALGYIVSEFGSTNSDTVLESESFAGKLAAAVADASAFTASDVLNSTGSWKSTKLKEGYVLVMTNQTTGGSGTVSNTSPIFTPIRSTAETTVTEKTSVPTVKKEVSEDGSEWGSDIDASIGETQYFKIVGTLPNNLDSYSGGYKYEFVDTLTNIEVVTAWAEFDKPDLTVEVKAGETTYTNRTPGTNETALPESAWTAKYENNKLTVTFDDIKSVPGVNANSTVTVQYRGRLTSNAKMGFAADNTNSVVLNYSNDPTNKSNTVPTVPTDGSKTHTYTYELDVTKIDHASNAPIGGVKFALTDISSGTAVDVNVTDGNGAYIVDSLTSGLSNVVTTKADGTLTIRGLDEGTYQLTETDVPDGYVREDDPFKFVITSDLKASPKTLSVTPSGPDGKTGYVTALANADTGKVSATIHNDAVTALPSTGQVRGVLIAVAGVALVAGGLFIGLRGRRKKDSAEE